MKDGSEYRGQFLKDDRHGDGKFIYKDRVDEDEVKNKDEEELMTSITVSDKHTKKKSFPREVYIGKFK